MTKAVSKGKTGKTYKKAVAKVEAGKVASGQPVKQNVELHQVIIAPMINEKSSAQREKHNQYAFEVHAKASKDEVRWAVERFFNVKVAAVRTLTNHGKVRRVGQSSGRMSNWKKAIVTLKEGSIDFFATA